MVDASQWYSLISVTTSAVALGLALYVLRRIANRRAADTFVAAMAFFFLAAVFAFLLRTSDVSATGGEASALTFGRLFYFFHMLAVGFTAATIGGYFLGFRVMSRRPVILGLQISLLVAAILVALQVQAVEGDPLTGTTVDSATATLLLAALSTAYMSTALAVLVRSFVKSKDRTVRRQALVMILGIVGHGFGAETYAYLRIGLYASPPPFLAITALVMASAFAFAVLRYRMFVVTPVREEPLALARKFPLKPGRAYVAREARPSLSLRALAEEARGGRAALVVSRLAPQAVREDFDLPATPVLWLTGAVGTNQVPPAEPEILERLVAEFAGQAGAPVVALDGVDYLVRHAGADRVRRVLEGLRDAVLGRGGIFLVSLGEAEGLPLEEFLQREFEPLPTAEPRGARTEDVFVIDAVGGILLSHTAHASRVDVDPDTMAGMLTAIMDFAKTSFAGNAGMLRRLELGSKSVALERGDRLILAVVFTGSEPPDVRTEMRAFLRRAESRFGRLLETWSGNMTEVRGLDGMAARLLL